MAPVVTSPKRKRGRKASASREDEDALGTQLAVPTNGKAARSKANSIIRDAEEDSRPAKRGRLAQAAASRDRNGENEQDTNNTDAIPSKRKRGRPAASAQNAQPEAEPGNSAPEDTRPRKRGRPAASQRKPVEVDREIASTLPTRQAPRKHTKPSQKGSREETEVSEISSDSQTKRRRQSARQVEATKGITEAGEEADDENEGNSSLLRRSKRERNKSSEWYKVSPVGSRAQIRTSNEKEEHHGGEDQEARAPARQKKAKTKDLSTLERSEPVVGAKRKASNAGGKKPGQHNHPTTTEEPGNSRTARDRTRPGHSTESEQRHRRSQHRKNAKEVEHGEEPDPDAESTLEQESAPKDGLQRNQKASSRFKRRHRSSGENDEARDSSPKAPYRILITRTRTITRHVIQTKWSPLDATSVDTVANLLHSASRPVLLRHNNATKQAQATAALNAISNRLRSKLIRGLPFPPATTSQRREDELEFELTIDGIQTLEAQLDPLLHGVALLEKEKKRAERELDREYRLLNRISTNARSEIRARKDQLRKVHSLVPDLIDLTDDDGSESTIKFKAGKKAGGRSFANLRDGELRGLAGQLGHHMESMRGNLHQINGIAPAIAESRAALRLALQPYLEEGLLDQIVLG